MSDPVNIDSDKRRTLKIFTGIASTGLLAGIPVLAKGYAEPGLPVGQGDIIHCTLVSCADVSRAHLLMHNMSDNEVAAARFNEQLIRFDNTLLNMANAYVEPVVIAAQDKILLRLNVDAGLQQEPTTANVIDMRPNTQYLPAGTRVVAFVVRVTKGVCTIDSYPIQA